MTCWCGDACERTPSYFDLPLILSCSKEVTTTPIECCRLKSHTLQGLMSPIVLYLWLTSIKYNYGKIKAATIDIKLLHISNAEPLWTRKVHGNCSLNCNCSFPCLWSWNVITKIINTIQNIRFLQIDSFFCT